MTLVWSFLFIFSIIISLVNMKPDIITSELMNGSKTAIENVIILAGNLCFWSGLFKIFENTSAIKKVSKFIKKITNKIFKKGEVSDTALDYISLNIASNMLGVSNASTLSGIKAMKEMDKDNKNKNRPSDSMAVFMTINAISIQLIPTTMITLRALYGSKSPSDIVIPVLIITGVSIITGILIIKLLNRLNI